MASSSWRLPAAAAAFIKLAAVLLASADAAVLQPSSSRAAAVTNLRGEVQELKQMIKGMQQSLAAKALGCCGGCKDVPFPFPAPPPVGPPSTSTKRSGAEPGLCAAFGDPHFTTFDGAHTVIFGDAALWLVKSEDVWIQGLSKTAMGRLMGLAVGGPFLGGHTLLLYNSSLTGGAGEPGTLSALFDGEPILADRDAQGSAEFDEPFVLWAARRAEWNASMHDQAVMEIDQAVDWAVGPWPERFQHTPEGGLFLFRFPRGIEITATGVDFMSAVIKMEPEPKGQSGFCGNFNGDAEDDFAPAAFGSAPPLTIAAWNRPVGDGLEPVADAENLFQRGGGAATASFAHEASPRTVDPQMASFSSRGGGGRRTWKWTPPPPCAEDRMSAAREACAGIPSHVMRLACIEDACRAGGAAAAAAAAEAEILQERVNVRGVPVFMGRGVCVDDEGRRFRALSAHGVRTSRGCRALLHGLGATRGVLGAELRLFAGCEILVDGAADLGAVAAAAAAAAAPPGGWAQDVQVSADRGGAFYIAGVVPNPIWSCWRLN